MKLSRVFYPLLIVSAGIAAFGTSVNGVFLWDDEYVVKRNLFIRDLSNLPLLLNSDYFEPAGTGHYTRSGEESYRPLVTLTHFIDFALFDLDPRGYHLVNIALHLAACISLYLMFLSLGLERAASLTGAMIFAVHPVNSETVNMISYREDLLAGVFFCIAFIQFLNRRLFLLLMFYTAALFSKEMALSLLPVALLHTALLPGKSGRKDPGTEFQQSSTQGKLLGNDSRLFVAMAAVAALYLIILFFAFPSKPPTGSSYPGGSFTAGIATMLRVVSTYAKLAVYPDGLSVDYGFIPSASFLNYRLIPAVLLLSTIFTTAFLVRDRKISFLILWFFISLLPVSGLYPITNFIAERYLYIPVMGLCGVFGVFFDTLRKHGFFLKTTAYILVSAALVFSLVQNNRRNAIWSDETLFFEEMVRANPSSHKGFSGLGMACYKNGLLEDAESNQRRSIELNENNAIAIHNLGCTLMKMGRRTEASEMFRKVIVLDESFTEAYYQLALNDRDEGFQEKAETGLRKALSLNPNFIPAKFILGVIMQDRGELGEAIQLYDEILAFDPKYAKALKNLGIIYFYKMNEPARGGEYFKRYLSVMPSDPQRELILEAINQS